MPRGWLTAQLLPNVAILILVGIFRLAFGPDVAASVLAAYICLFIPLLGFRSYTELARDCRRNPNARLLAYRGLILARVALLTALGVALLGSGLDVVTPYAAHFGKNAAALTAEAVFISLLGAFTVVRSIETSRARFVYALRRLVRAVGALLPRTRQERKHYVLAAVVVAAVSEEILYRGFLITYVTHVASHVSPYVAICIVAAFFGLAHLYQGGRGALMATIGGIVLGVFTVACGSLLPAIILHAFLNLRVVLLPQDLVEEAFEFEYGTKDQFLVS